MEEKHITLQKALQLNLNPNRYGTIAEIGAGQEVARFFFQAGGAAGTVAKTMSAYDMQVSDSIYGESTRYVSKERVQTMVDREFGLLIDRLKSIRAPETTYFAFADTVAARGYKSDRECHGWIGIKFQLIPGGEPNEIILHVRLHDKTNQQQQTALGVLGVNLIYGAFEHWSDPRKLIETLLDEVSWERTEIDYIYFNGPQFVGIDNRLMMLHLVTVGHTEAAMFDANGEPVIPAEVLYKKDVLVLRGNFRPPTNLHFDMVNRSMEKFIKEEGGDRESSLTLFEMNMRSFMAGNVLDGRELLARMDMMAAMGYPVLISRYLRYFRLNEFLATFCQGKVRFVLSVANIETIFDDKYYEGYEGGTLLATGQLFSRDVKLYVYPSMSADKVCTGLDDIKIDASVELLYEHLIRNERILSLQPSSEETRFPDSEEVLEKIAGGTDDWCDAVPQRVADVIKNKKLFGYTSKK